MITETAAARLPSTRCKKLGDGMLTPAQPLEFRNPQTGRVEQLLPGRDCVAPQWFGYRKHPEFFVPANRDDADTVDRHRETLERARRLVERRRGRTGTARATSSRPKRFQLSGPPRDRWRLP
jgi:hypothetical protein